MVFGAFDVLHPGHLDFFRQARRLSANPFLTVSVARDTNVKKIKGRKPLFPESARADFVKECGLADKVVLGGTRFFIPNIIKEHPDIIALGYDQTAYVKNLKADLNQVGLDVKIKRLKAFKPHVYKSSLFKSGNPAKI